jgi:hypothetical protein
MSLGVIGLNICALSWIWLEVQLSSVWIEHSSLCHCQSVWAVKVQGIS